MNFLKKLYPVLLSAYPLLSLYSANQSLLPMNELIRPLVIWACLSVLLTLLLNLLTKDYAKASVGVSAVLVSMLTYSAWSEWLPVILDSPLYVVIWAVVTLLGATLLMRFWRWHTALAIFAGALCLMAIGSIVGAGVSRSDRTEATELDRTDARPDEHHPDIIYIILDGYGRSDVFEEMYDFSDKDFLAALSKRGFKTATQAHANYCQTELSISSSLNLDYVQSLSSITKSNERPSFQTAINDNALLKYLREKEYEFTYIGTGFPPLQFTDAGQSYGRKGLGLFEILLIQKTPFRSLLEGPLSQFETRRRLIDDAFQKLGNVRFRQKGPRFTFAHILAPHPPFVFGPNGEKRLPKYAYGFWDGSDYMRVAGSQESYRLGYRDQSQHIAKKVLAAVDEILKQYKEPPIILIQGDHGPKLGLDQSSLESTNIHECFPILSTYLGPPQLLAEIYPDMTPVNSFRTILRVVFGESLQNLPDRSWYSTFGRPLEFTEVTDRLKK